MSLKAAECGLLLPFVMHITRKFGGVSVHGPFLIQAGQSLLSLLGTIRGHRCIVPVEVRQTLILQYDMHLRCCVACSIALAPKHHLTVHMLFR